MPDKPYEGEDPYLEGALDSSPEVKLTMNFLCEEGYAVRYLEQKEIDGFFEEIKRRHREKGYKDTPSDVKIFLEYLRRNRILHGAVDMDYEIEHFNKVNINQDILDQRANQKIIDHMKKSGLFDRKPSSKKRKRLTIDEEDPDNDNSYGGPKS